jgi:CRP-like cAMP-binding protein
MPSSPCNTHRDRLHQSDCRNYLLASLPANVYDRLSPYLQPVDLTLGTVLYEPHDVIHTVYFPNQAMVSLVQIMQDGSTIEAGVVGHYGLVGYAVYLGGNCSSSRAIVQIAGSTIALDAAILKAEFKRPGALQELLLRYSQAFIAQISQTAACNRFHLAEERLARWLLQSQDALQSPHLDLTQDFLSSMLGTRRASVTLAAGRLQQAGLIRYSRGHIEILDREGLESTACECYEVVRAEYERLLSP